MNKLATIFFLVSIGVGLALIFGLIAPSIHSYWRTRGQVTTSAILTEVKLETHNGGSRRRSSTAARYRYQFNGRSYEGDELSIFRYTGDFYDDLKLALDQNRPIRIYVDPLNPRYSVYDRDFSIWPFAGGLIMALGFTGLGAHGLCWMFKQRSKNISTPHPKNRHWVNQ